MRKIVIICLATIPLWTSACSGQTKHSNMEAKHCDMETIQNDTTYIVWSTLNVYLKDGTERYDFNASNEFIAQLPVPVKTIIARYTAFLPDYLLDKETELNFAKALGGFSTLEEARHALLKDWTGEDLVILSGFPSYLGLKETKESLLFEYPVYKGKRTDEFKIDENGRITYLKQPEPIEQIPYSRKVLLDKYQFYRFRLNGEPLEYFLFLYLDPDNIKSVGVNERDNIVYIEQKNKNPKYFVRSDLTQCLEYLTAFKVKSLDEIAIITIDDGRTNLVNNFYDNCKIEESAIKSIGSDIILPDEGNLKVVVIELKDKDSE